MLKRCLCIFMGILYLAAQPISAVSALSTEQKKVYSSGVNYFDVLLGCGSVADSAAAAVEPGAGEPEGTTFPKLDPAAMGTAIDKYIAQTNPNSKMKGLGATLVASAEKADINPFLVVSIAQKESQLSDPSDFNVKNGNNSFGRTATSSQPNFQGARLWYKWTSVKASVDYTAAENKGAAGGGDAAAYLRNQYGTQLDAGQLAAFMNQYAPPGDGNDTPKYISDIKTWMGKMIALTDKTAPAADAGASAAATPDASAAATPAGGSVYMVGDSITLGAKDALEAGFKDQGFTSAYINASVSRSITGKGTTAGAKTSGLEAVEGDKARIKTASTVVVALGTNQNPNFEASIKDLIDSIKAINPDAKIFWVNTFSPAVDTDKINKSIAKMAASENFTVIDTKGKGIEVGSDRIHPTAEGSSVFAKTVSGSLGGGGGPADSAGTGSQCSCAAGADNSDTSLVGSDRAEKIFNFFTSNGLTPFQAAGIMGNMNAESGLNPRALQPGTTGDAPISGRGYGLVQWTFPARQDPLIKKAQDTGKKVYDLGLQLSYVLDELAGSHKTAGENLKKTTTVEEATLVIELQYEVHAGGVQPQRTTDAKAFLAKYGSGAPSGSTGATGASTCAGAAGADAGADPAAGGDASAFTGTAQEAAKALLNNSGVKILDDRDLVQKMADGQPTPLDEKLIKMLAGMAKSHTFSISSMYRGPCSGSNHCVGKAADINPTIDGQTISYSENNAKIQAFIDDAAKIMGGNCENGVPNQAYVDKTKAGGSKCQVFVDKGTGPHVHLAVSA